MGGPNVRWSGLVEEEFRRAVEIAEQCADGLAERKNLRAASEDIWFLKWGSVRGESAANAAAEAAVEDSRPILPIPVGLPQPGLCAVKCGPAHPQGRAVGKLLGGGSYLLTTGHHYVIMSV